jgi:hypothetical protein
VPLCPPQIPHVLSPGSNPDLRGGRPAVNHLSHDSAYISTYKHFNEGREEICPHLGYYAALSGSSVPTFRDNLSVPYSKVKKSKKKLLSFTSWTLKMGQIGYPETSVQNYYSVLRNIPEEGRSRLHRGGSLKSRKEGNCYRLCSVWIKKVYKIERTNIKTYLKNIILCYCQ